MSENVGGGFHRGQGFGGGSAGGGVGGVVLEKISQGRFKLGRFESSGDFGGGLLEAGDALGVFALYVQQLGREIFAPSDGGCAEGFAALGEAFLEGFEEVELLVEVVAGDAAAGFDD